MAFTVVLSNVKKIICNWLRHDSEEEYLHERIGHELRTALTTIQGYSEYVEMNSKEPLLKFTASILKESSYDLSSICDATVELARLNSKSIKLAPKEINLVDLASKLQIENYLIAQNKNIYFEVRVIGSAGVVAVDFHKLEKLITAIGHEMIYGTEMLRRIEVDIKTNNEASMLEVVFKLQRDKCDCEYHEKYAQFWREDKYKYHLQEGPGVRLAYAKKLLSMLRGYSWYTWDVLGHSETTLQIPLEH